MLKPRDKLKSILIGWKNYIFESNAVELMAKLRAVECAKCDEAVPNVITDLIVDDITEIQGLVCKQCTCPLSSKLRSPGESCPLNKWQAV